MTIRAFSKGQSEPKPGQIDLIEECLAYDWTTILDVGAGTGWVSQRFLKAGRMPYTTFALAPCPGVPDFGKIPIEDMGGIRDETMDAIWAAHVLEHCYNTGLALTEMRRILRPGGLLFLSVPPFKHAVVGGHVNVGWNLGLLAYVLAIHGFDAQKGAFVRHGYNLAAFVAKTELPHIELSHDEGDLELLHNHLPETFSIMQGTNGDVRNINWRWRITPEFREHPLKAAVQSYMQKVFYSILA